MVYPAGYVSLTARFSSTSHPERLAASKMVDSSTPFAYDSRTQMYLQGLYAQQSLSRLLTVNKAALGSITLDKDIELEKRTPISANTSLAEVAEIGSKESHNAPALLAAVMERLGEQTKFAS